MEFGEGGLPEWVVGDLVALVRRRYPGWEGFDDARFVADEIEYKRATVARAGRELAAGELQELLAQWQYDEILGRLERLGRHNNLLWTRVPRQGDLNILYESAGDKAGFCHQMVQLLHGREPAAERLHAFVRYASHHHLPIKWTFPTYFLFITHPEAEIFVKPTVMDWFLKFVGEAAGLPATPAGPAYAAVRGRVGQLREALVPLGAEDMVAMQSFIWVAFRESGEQTGRLDVRGQVELDVPPVAYEVPAQGLFLREAAETGAETEAQSEEAEEEMVAAEEVPYTLAEFAAESGVEEGRLAGWVRAVARKGQAVFYGPPGTGKTFLARQMARHLTAGGDGFWELVQFHPAYSYEEFMQGIRPVTRPDGTVGYELVPGRFLRFCEQAAGREGLCVLIIDEINRANLAAVFGELMYLLEYREEEAALAGGGRLRIPANVRILGTMNTADRSIALVDHALRRRFAFIALRPDYELLRRYHEGADFDVEPLVRLLQEVNSQINDPHYEIGVSFFLRPELGEELADIWQMEIEPYLEEYFFSRPEQAAAFRWEEVRGRL